MEDFIILVILVAWFFGISYGAALHGIINFVFWTILFSIAFTFIKDLITTPATPQPQPKEVPKAKVTKPSKPMPKAVYWGVYFFVSYLITFLFLIIIGIWETPYPAPMWLVAGLPSLPFALTLGVHLVRKHRTNKKRTRVRVR